MLARREEYAMTTMNELIRCCSQAEIEERAAMIASDLRSMGDGERSLSMQRYFKESTPLLGIDTATLRRYAASQIDELQFGWNLAEAISLCDELVGEPEIEIRGMGIQILAAFEEEFCPRVLIPKAREWLDGRFDNWALVDSFCAQALSPLFENYPSIEPTLRKWCHAESLWLRRASLVTLVPFAREGEFLHFSYDIAKEHFSSSEDLIHKATGWLLREAGKTDMRRLRTYLLEHGPAIPRTAVRYAIERYPAKERKQLLQRTRMKLP
ncbi:DNA alkylation repair enzyme superfamily [Verrucomicrobiia bacterium DG1235]|nr:DNA alkylation repair enzyme superfamily [Verrucomicrobiae bacterium DG1235]